MLIALDYDDTFTRDPFLWEKLIVLGAIAGHEFVIATNREPEHLREIENEVCRYRDKILTIIPCGSRLKRAALAEKGIHPHVWIDDCPEMIGGEGILIGGEQ